MTATRPLIGVSACRQTVDDQDYHLVGEKYLLAAAESAGGAPVILPALAGAADVPALLARLDGLLLTGSPSNVEPHQYGGPPSAPGTRHDPWRDATTLPLIRAALAEGVPTLAICRGMQELNVVLGGSLHQRIEEIPGKLNHQADPRAPIETRYGPAHAVRLTPGGLLARLAAAAGLAADGEIEVNSLHSQGIDRLADGLAVEAVAPDGIIESVRVAEAKAFALAVQWHPEWRAQDNPLSRAIFAAFGEAAGSRAAGHRSGARAAALADTAARH